MWASASDKSSTNKRLENLSQERQKKRSPGLCTVVDMDLARKRFHNILSADRCFDRTRTSLPLPTCP